MTKSLIETVARLKNLESRRQAIINRQKETAKPNHALLELLEIERALSNTAPMLLDVLGEIRVGDADRLEEMISWMETQSEDARATGVSDNFLGEEIEVLHRYHDMAAKMEATR